MLQTDEYIIQHTQHWIRSFIINLNICPFAKHEVQRGSLRIEVCSEKKFAAILEKLMTEVQLLDNESAIATTLLIVPSLKDNFFHYLDLLDLAERLLSEQGYEGTYQLASFHPQYCFDGVDFDDASNYTNRSPYPMLHILAEESVEKAIAFYGDTQKIPEENIRAMHRLGVDEIRRILADCVPD